MNATVIRANRNKSGVWFGTTDGPVSSWLVRFDDFTEQHIPFIKCKGNYANVGDRVTIEGDTIVDRLAF